MTFTSIMYAALVVLVVFVIGVRVGLKMKERFFEKVAEGLTRKLLEEIEVANRVGGEIGVRAEIRRLRRKLLPPETNDGKMAP